MGILVPLVQQLLGGGTFEVMKFQTLSGPDARLKAVNNLHTLSIGLLDGEKYFDMLCELCANSRKPEVVFTTKGGYATTLPCHLKNIYMARAIHMNPKGSFDFIVRYEKQVNPFNYWKVKWIRAGLLKLDGMVTMSSCYAQVFVFGIENDVKCDTTTTMDAAVLLKETFQVMVGLLGDENIFMINVWGRIEEQTGCNIPLVAIYQLLVIGLQMVAHGIDRKKWEQQIELLEVLFCNKTAEAGRLGGLYSEIKQAISLDDETSSKSREKQNDQTKIFFCQQLLVLLNYKHCWMFAKVWKKKIILADFMVSRVLNACKGLVVIALGRCRCFGRMFRHLFFLEDKEVFKGEELIRFKMEDVGAISGTCTIGLRGCTVKLARGIG